MHLFKKCTFISAIMEVHSDFFFYESGVYHRTNLAIKDKSGYHSVKIIGWGRENGTPYWVRRKFVLPTHFKIAFMSS